MNGPCRPVESSGNDKKKKELDRDRNRKTLLFTVLCVFAISILGDFLILSLESGPCSNGVEVKFEGNAVSTVSVF